MSHRPISGSRPSALVCGLIAFSAPLACTLPTSGTETHDTRPADDSSSQVPDDSPGHDSAPHGDDSCTSGDSSALDDTSITSGDIEWTLVDSTNGPISHQWAVCDPHDCYYSDAALCGGVSLGIVTSQYQLATIYAEFLPGVDYVPEIDFSSHMAVWSSLCCCPNLGSWLVVDDVRRIGKTVELSMHTDSSKLAPAAFGRPWVVVQIPLGHYNDVTYKL
jgi:hypothetical protein